MQPLNAAGIPRLLAREDVNYEDAYCQPAATSSAAVYVRLDMLNVFNNTNYSDYNVDYGSNGNLPANPVTFNQVGNILGTPRTLKLQAGVKF
jgi:hypothetical protein